MIPRGMRLGIELEPTVGGKVRVSVQMKRGTATATMSEKDYDDETKAWLAVVSFGERQLEEIGLSKSPAIEVSDD